MPKQMYEDLLIDLCEPYLLDLIGLLAECMRRLEDTVFNMAINSGYDIPDQVLVRIDMLDSLQKAEVLFVAAGHLKEIAQREKKL